MKIFQLSIPFFCLMILCGCGVGYVRSKEMVVNTVVIENPSFKKNIYLLNVTGSLEMSDFHAIPGVQENELGDAVIQSLSEVGVLAENREEAKYWLSISYLGTESDTYGFNITATAQLFYTLVDKETNKTILLESISSQYTAPPTAAYSILLRIRRAVEGALRTNIESFLLRLDTLQLKEQPIIKK